MVERRLVSLGDATRRNDQVSLGTTMLFVSNAPAKDGDVIAFADPNTSQPWDGKPKVDPDKLNLNPIATQLAPMLGATPVIASAHPSPLSASSGFFGSKPFSQANAFLQAHGRGTIDWRA